jgi:hypothetical protein
MKPAPPVTKVVSFVMCVSTGPLEGSLARFFDRLGVLVRYPWVEESMYYGSRVTDAVRYCARRDDRRSAIAYVEKRSPERFRWRHAMADLNGWAGQLRGKRREEIEAPVREMVLEVEDEPLKWEVVIDARARGVDLDRGELLTRRSLSDLRLFAWQLGVEIDPLRRHLRLPEDLFAPIDTAAVILVGRQLAHAHRSKARQLWLRIPDPDGPGEPMLHHRYMAERAEREEKEAERWNRLTRALLAAPSA